MGKLQSVKRDELGRIPQIWTIESAIEESKKYKTRKEFRTGKSKSAYRYLVKHKKIDLAFNQEGKRHRLSNWEIFCSLKKSSSWGEFMNVFPKEYTAFLKRKCQIKSSAYSHLGKSLTGKKWDKESILLEALKYETRSSFGKNASGAYDAALRQGLLNEVCSHMKTFTSDFDCVYAWTAGIVDGNILVKFGVTSKRLGLTRIKFVEKKSGFIADEIIIKETSNALEVESKLKKIGVKAELDCFNGSTEFFLVTENQMQEVKRILTNESKN